MWFGCLIFLLLLFRHGGVCVAVSVRVGMTGGSTGEQLIGRRQQHLGVQCLSGPVTPTTRSRTRSPGVDTRFGGMCGFRGGGRRQVGSHVGDGVCIRVMRRVGGGHVGGERVGGGGGGVLGGCVCGQYRTRRIHHRC